MSYRPKYGKDIPAEDISVSRIWELLTALLFADQKPSQVQHDEMRRAFFIGVTEAFALFTDLSDNLSEDEACKALDRLKKECDKFHAEEIGRLIPSKGKA